MGLGKKEADGVGQKGEASNAGGSGLGADSFSSSSLVLLAHVCVDPSALWRLNSGKGILGFSCCFFMSLN